MLHFAVSVVHLQLKNLYLIYHHQKCIFHLNLNHNYKNYKKSSLQCYFLF